MSQSPPSADHLDDPVVNHMRRDFLRLSSRDTVGEALSRLQGSQPEGRIVYFYVLDDDNRLVGVLPTRRLLLSPPETPVNQLMERRMITLPDSATSLDACEFFILHRLLALPVVDSQRHMLGIVDVELYTDEVAELARREESEDVFQLIGVRLASVRQASLLRAVRARFPWLLCNIVGGLVCAVLASFFEGVLDRVIVLAGFIPLVLTLAESVSIQSLTLALQLPSAKRSGWATLLGLVRREVLIGALLGIGCGALVGVVEWLWRGHVPVAMCILTSIAISVSAAALIGWFVPTVLRAIDRDPKVAAGPIALATTDVTTLLCYFGVAAWMFAGR
jgi:magnesium transporter